MGQESKRKTARNIRFFRGKTNTGSTTMVTVELEQGKLKDITDKKGMEQAIMENNIAKFNKSVHAPFFQKPLLKDFGVKRTTQAATVVWQVYMDQFNPPGSCKQCHTTTTIANQSSKFRTISNATIDRRKPSLLDKSQGKHLLRSRTFKFFHNEGGSKQWHDLNHRLSAHKNPPKKRDILLPTGVPL